ncbi:hypothetical protein BCV70DRAFT_201861 [Testicularia cyperi]|uniref:Uncharacterized protein n=1 Tax=Testicularia cyperi TaxID=1882483 RepID=A0A317XJR2_9BASI|nr:hypothetical protein BCV70DRAFT_201861 [Testicularia cyperi]
MAVVSSSLACGFDLPNTVASKSDLALDPRKSLPDYRLEIYNLLQYLDEQQDKIEHALAQFSPQSRRLAGAKTSTHSEDEDEDDEEDDFVVVEDVNLAIRKKQLLNQLQQLWRSRETIRQRARDLNIRIDSLEHGRNAGLMSRVDLDNDKIASDELELGEEI